MEKRVSDKQPEKEAEAAKGQWRLQMLISVFLNRRLHAPVFRNVMNVSQGANIERQSCWRRRGGDAVLGESAALCSRADAHHPARAAECFPPY